MDDKIQISSRQFQHEQIELIKNFIVDFNAIFNQLEEFISEKLNEIELE